MGWMRPALLAWTLVLLSCKGPTTEVPTPTADADTDTDTDSDADTDTDTDADTDTDTECNLGAASPAPGGTSWGACVTAEIHCGETIQGENIGGSTTFGTAQGEAFWMCSGAASGSDFAGPERVYRLVPDPGTTAVRLTLESCEESELLYHREATSCWDTALPACGYVAVDPVSHTDQTEDILLGGDQLTLVVEGFGNEGGGFELTVECFQ